MHVKAEKNAINARVSAEDLSEEWPREAADWRKGNTNRTIKRD